MPLNTQLLRDVCRSGNLTLRVRDQCMSPLILHGERVRVKSCRFYWPGDIVVFRYIDGGLRIHRLIAYRIKNRSLQLITRGDRTKSFDAPICRDQVIGKVTAVASRDLKDRLNRIRALTWGMMALGRMAARVLIERVRLTCSVKNS